MSKITEVRLTLAAFIYGIDIDLKNIIKKYIIPFQQDINFINDPDLELKVIDRYKSENPDLNYKNSLEDVIDYLDFGDSIVVLRKNHPFLPKLLFEFLNSINGELTAMTPIRNRVMHTRPLLSGDFSYVYDFISKLKPTDPIDWKITIIYLQLKWRKIETTLNA